MAKHEVSLLLLDPCVRSFLRVTDMTPALKTIAHLRNLPEDHPYVQYELLGIMGQFEYERAQLGNTGHFSVVRETFSRRNARRLFTGCMISEYLQSICVGCIPEPCRCCTYSWSCCVPFENDRADKQ